MQTKTKHEEEILKEIRDLPEIVQEKMLKIVHFLKSEIIENKSTEENATADFLSVCGTWEDNKSIEEQIRDVYSSRKSTSRTENVF